MTTLRPYGRVERDSHTPREVLSQIPRTSPDVLSQAPDNPGSVDSDQRTTQELLSQTACTPREVLSQTPEIREVLSQTTRQPGKC